MPLKLILENQFGEESINIPTGLLLSGEGVPTDGVTGKDTSPLGGLYWNELTGDVYKNGGTESSPVWSLFGEGGGGGSVDSVTASAPVESSGGANPDISMAAATDSIDGYLTAEDHAAFAAKQPAGNYVTGLTGDVTASGPGSVAATLATVNSGPGTYGSASKSPTLAVDGKGRVTSSSDQNIQIAESQVTNLVSDLANKQPVGNYITALTGDVTASGPGSAASTIGASKVTNAKLATMAGLTMKGNLTGLASNPSDLTVDQVNSLIKARSTFVFQPGGTATGNVFTDWATLWSKVTLQSGVRFVYFDNSFTDPIVIPAGTYTGAKGVVFVGCDNSPEFTVEVQVSNGATFDDLPQLNNIQLNSLSNGPVVSLSSGIGVWVLDNGASLLSQNSEIIKLDGAQVILYVKTGASVARAGYEDFNLINSGSLIVYLEEATSMDSDTVRDDGSGSLLIYVASASANLPASMVNLSGGFGITLAELASQILVGFGTDSSNVAAGLQTGQLQTQYLTTTSGSTLTVPDGSGGIMVHATGTLATQTIQLPANPLPWQVVEIQTDVAITTLTVSGNGKTLVGTAPTTLVAGGHFSYRYNPTAGNWWPR